MKIIHIFIAFMLSVFFTTTISATNVNGRFVVNGVNNGRLEVLLQINTNTGSDDMGGATIVVGFNTNSLSYSSSPQLNTDYIFHHFSGGNYSPATVTKPAVDKLWLNIDLPYNYNNNGYVVSGTAGWTDVATLFFNIVNPADTLQLNWLTANSFWAIYDANNTILWTPGTFQNMRYVVNTDLTPPQMSGAALLDSTKLEILFSEPMDSVSAVKISNYSINNGVSIQGAYLSGNHNKVTLSTGCHSVGQSYTVTAANVHDLAGNNIQPDHNSAAYTYIADTSAPGVTGIIVTNNQSITVTFSEKLDPVTAKNKSNYSISRNISIVSATLLPDSSQVKLKTSKHSRNVDYTITVSNIKDKAGNIQSPNPKTFTYRITGRTNGSVMKNNINTAMASSWHQNYTPDKTIDGQGMTNPESRWESQKIMPDTITYDLKENVLMAGVKISFYQAEAGRLYKFSICTSLDMREWSTIAKDIWSDESEWTEIEFDSTNSRYIRLVLQESNYGNKAGIWEFESLGLIEQNGTNQNLTPANFELFQNYPNPFNPTTKISWQCPVSGHQSLKVYDMLGNEVMTLVDEFRAAGIYEVNFDAANLASGVYVYRLTADNFSETKKMVLLR